jgi:hypothetical protein
MTRFVVGEDRNQSTLFPERLEDDLSEDNPVRAIDVFVDELDLAGLALAVLSRRRQEGRPIGDVVEDLRLRIPQSGAVEPTPGAGVPAQHPGGLADRPPDAGRQDHASPGKPDEENGTELC